MARTSANSPKKRGRGKSRVENTQVGSSKTGRHSRAVVQGDSDDDDGRPVSDEELRIALDSHARRQSKSSAWTPKATPRKRKPKDLEDENPTKRVRSKGGDKSRDFAENSQAYKYRAPQIDVNARQGHPSTPTPAPPNNERSHARRLTRNSQGPVRDASPKSDREDVMDDEGEERRNVQSEGDTDSEGRSEADDDEDLYLDEVPRWTDEPDRDVDFKDEDADQDDQLQNDQLEPFSPVNSRRRSPSTEAEDAPPPSQNRQRSLSKRQSRTVQGDEDLDDDHGMNMDDLHDEVKELAKPKKKTARDRKLEEEMPTIGDRPTVSKSKSKSKFERAGVNPTANTKHPPWLPRTKIILTGSHTPSINLNDQSDEITEVLHSSFTIGKIKMLTDTQYSPVADGGLDRIAIDSLIDAAVKLKYNEKGDIAARLRHGKYDYVHPLREYCMRRLSKERNTIKKAASIVVPDKFKAILSSGGHEIHDFILSSTYIYPKVINPAPRDPEYDNSKPFQHPAVLQIISTGVKDVLKTVTGVTFKSSLATAPNEFELHDAMVALAATSIAAILSEHEGGKTEDFSGTYYDLIYRGHLAILDKMSTDEQYISVYHELMHTFYSAVKGPKLNAISQDRMVAGVDWGKMAVPGRG